MKFHVECSQNHVWAPPGARVMSIFIKINIFVKGREGNGREKEKGKRKKGKGRDRTPLYNRLPFRVDRHIVDGNI